MIRPAFDHVRRSAWLLCALASLGLGGPASAQRTATKDSEATRSEALLHDRNRAAMHPGDPLKIVGLEQGGNAIRSGTSMLAQSDRAVALVNTDENYRRTLAMYEDDATFHQPLSLLSPPAPAMSDATAGIGPASSRTAAPVAGDAIGSDWPWVLGLGLVALVMIWMQKRGARVPVGQGMSRSRPA